MPTPPHFTGAERAVQRVQVHGEGGVAGGRFNGAERRETHAEEAAGRHRPGCEVLRRSGARSAQLIRHNNNKKLK